MSGSVVWAFTISSRRREIVGAHTTRRECCKLLVKWILCSSIATVLHKRAWSKLGIGVCSQGKSDVVLGIFECLYQGWSRLSLNIEYLCYFRAMISLNWRRRLQWYIWIANVDMEEDRGVRRFRPPKTEEEERLLLDSTVPKNTQHNTKWTVKVFEEWQSSRRDKAPR